MHAASSADLCRYCVLLQVPKTPPSSPRTPSLPSSPPDDIEEVLRFSAASRLQDDGRDSYFKSGIGVTLKMRPVDTQAAPCRTRLAKRLFRDVDSLAAARSEVKASTLRTHELERELRRVEICTKDSSQRALIAQRALENEVEVLQERVALAEKMARWRNNERVSWESKAAKAIGLQREAHTEAMQYKRKAEEQGTQVTAAERAADTAKHKYKHVKEGLRTGAEERSSLSEQIQQQRHQIRGECCTRPSVAAHASDVRPRLHRA